ncbi:DUF2794 domain-containing protein [Ferrovibrio sp.]|uniref:DUF2794 domain-containing protein n=1 Tax=Ferrovibrio sp. TaxID=1917215 RepID=UPI0025C51EEC|nr:DUF2794 domain-containing protein [Ferrovibrio sp.]MBX3454582.1 DUF2794 domain-containing protein [Ferrovibrio sp.]
MSEVVAIDEYRRPGSAHADPARSGPAGKQGQAQAAVVAHTVIAAHTIIAHSNNPQSNPDKQVFFDRYEFAVILNLYSRMVGRGEWRDYAIGHDRESCSFAVFRRTADGALFRIVKTPKLARKQGAFAILGQGGRILRRGRDLKIMLRYFEPKRDALA